jgi:hypothetical protein
MLRGWLTHALAQLWPVVIPMNMAMDDQGQAFTSQLPPSID